MKKTVTLFLVVLFWNACGSPPSRPESLWDSSSGSEEGQAKQSPAKVWEGDSSSTSAPEEEIPEVEGTVVLNEIYYDAAGSDTDGLLFVEIYGTPALAIGGYKINFVNGSDGAIYDSVVIPDGSIVRADGFFLVVDSRDGSPTVSQVPAPDLPDLIDNFDLQNGPDAVQLLDSTGQLIDAVGYGEGIARLAENGLAVFEGTAAPDIASGHSLERKAAGLDTNNNMDDFSEREVPTPGESPADQPTDTGSSVPPLPEPSSSEPLPPAEPSPEPTPPPPPGKVVLNEIFYDAVGSDTDGMLFVELYGTPGMDLTGYRINFVDGADGSIDDSITIPDEILIPPDGFYLIADSKVGFPTESNVFGADLIDNFDPQNGPDAVQLLNPSGALIDAVGYGDGIVPLAQNGLASFETLAAPDVVDGHSLERREPGLDSDNNFNDFADREIPTPGQ